MKTTGPFFISDTVNPQRYNGQILALFFFNLVMRRMNTDSSNTMVQLLIQPIIQWLPYRIFFGKNNQLCFLAFSFIRSIVTLLLFVRNAPKMVMITMHIYKQRITLKKLSCIQHRQFIQIKTSHTLLITCTPDVTHV